MKRLPRLDLLYWLMIISANTIGESGGDLISMTTGLGYGASTLVLMGLLVLALIIQLAMKIQHPIMYWIVIILTSTAGTTMADLVTREWFGNMPVVAATDSGNAAPTTAPKFVATDKVESTQPAEATTQESNKPQDEERLAGYGKGVLSILITLALIFIVRQTIAPSTHIDDPMSRVSEFLYWAAILASSTLGTALGDYLADEHTGLQMGFGPSTMILIGALAVITLITLFTKLSRDWLYWAAIVITHPLGATAGDLMTKGKERGGWDLGNLNATIILTAIFLVISTVTFVRNRVVKDALPHKSGL